MCEEVDMTQTASRFLNEEEIELAKNEAGMIFWQDPEDVLVTVEQQEVEVWDPFYPSCDTREMKEAQVVTFASSRPVPWRVASLQLVVADASCLCIGGDYRMPCAHQVVERARMLKSLRKLRRIIIDGWVIILEFRSQLSCREIVQAISAFVSGFMIDDDGIAIGDDQTWVAIRYGLHK
jgi:hypothetical protein